ncbi:hypothetical protein NV379_13420 [Paenibacillus sp. N1-5-1-14]|uniref:hypothetical protein n=1 Tax=Paenibacillus radicibacter TaxID=2972488 RepID=UPI0021598390|nr:hypothetical protein [Paenibacillus radicibacter]MCR8643651.1 hypothetical protein [Paenibacillus radicibacter]
MEIDARTRSEINSIIRQIYSITRELDSISTGMRNEFKGIGTQICANKIMNMSESYREVASSLQRL